MARIFHVNSSMSADNQKKLAAEKAVESIKDGMVIGLGTGSTFQFALEVISKKIKDGSLKNIVGVPTSEQTKNEAIRLGIPITTLNELVQNSELRSQNSATSIKNQESSIKQQVSIQKYPKLIDVTIDGADEAAVSRPESGEGSPIINLIKGGGGAMLREKVIAQNSTKNIIIIDKTKLSEKLGEKFSVPVEVLQFSFKAEKKFLESLGATVTIRKNANSPNLVTKTNTGDVSDNFFVTDENNFILDANFGVIENVEELNNILNNRAGIVEHGLFVNIADEIICGSERINKK
ncbi:MAG: ribose 5-phosphate isomerase A [Bacteroidota bacterium]